ncbi:MAG TPA: hypothetical protein VFX39_02380, partial [Gemmatimonadaceae bacterium]|nr:hypothetical protein [Gemmatimonadaceae bacterium]
EPETAPAAESAVESGVESDAPIAEVSERDESPDDDPWIFEGERMAAAGISGEWDAVDEVVPGPVVEPFTGEAVANDPVADQHVANESVASAPVTSDSVEAGRASTGAPASETLDELLARPVPNADEHAAGALAAATLSMQNDPEVNAQLGEAAAEDPSSLLHLLRGTPRSVASLRQGASFSFDQFFRVDEPEARAGSGAGGAAGSAPADAGSGKSTSGRDAAPAGDSGAESDLADFHAWLSGLSKS